MAQESPEDYAAFATMRSPEFQTWVRYTWTPEFQALRHCAQTPEFHALAHYITLTPDLCAWCDYAKTPECRKATDFFLRLVERLGDLNLIEIPRYDLQ